MRKNEFQLLVEELAAYKREHDSQMAKALRAPKITRLDGSDIQGMFRLTKARKEQAERERLERQRAQRAQEAQARRQRFTETLTKAHLALRSEVLAGHVSAHEAAKGEATLHRLAGAVIR
ncbi:hypothetical protein [Azospirillum brasilense]|uniref:hypothetical protein n=1 Tax=Azospirillum brasilense TaxID=192 RepID=UPI001EDA70C3|nr:hypothetical protein [Azospirillum brasilense]UKJ74247.1 hypothetical protein H1Q64_06590 [Azospirillum brasilense]